MKKANIIFDCGTEKHRRTQCVWMSFWIHSIFYYFSRFSIFFHSFRFFSCFSFFSLFYHPLEIFVFLCFFRFFCFFLCIICFLGFLGFLGLLCFLCFFSVFSRFSLFFMFLSVCYKFLLFVYHLLKIYHFFLVKEGFCYNQNMNKQNSDKNYSAPMWSKVNHLAISWIIFHGKYFTIRRVQFSKF